MLDILDNYMGHNGMGRNYMGHNDMVYQKRTVDQQDYLWVAIWWQNHQDADLHEYLWAEGSTNL